MAFEHYLEAAFWSSMSDYDKEEYFDENYYASDLSDETRAHLQKVYDSFWSENQDLLSDAMDYEGSEQIDRDLWFEHNGYGIGFMDRDYPEALAKKLTAAAKKYPQIDLYVGDGAKIYHM